MLLVTSQFFLETTVIPLVSVIVSLDIELHVSQGKVIQVSQILALL